MTTPAEQSMPLVRCEIVEPFVALVTLDNPPVNAHNRQMLDEIMATFDRLSDLDDVRAVVLTGHGKQFCAGVDLRARSGPGGPGEHWGSSRAAREAYHAIMECAKPVVGALNGVALGGGLALAASCDILVAAETACLGLPEIDVGLMGGQRHAQRLFSHSRLRRMALTGYRVFGPELYRLGVVEACVPADQVVAEALGIARSIAAKSPLAARMAKQSLNQIEEMSLRDGYRFEQGLTGALRQTADSREAVAAFFEKRPPVFTGK